MNDSVRKRFKYKLNDEITTTCKVDFWTDIKSFSFKWTHKNSLRKFLWDNQKKDVIIKLLSDLYVDDARTSFDSINTSIQFYEISKSCLLEGHFALRKWVTNDRKLQVFMDAKENENTVQNGIYRKVLR